MSNGERSGDKRSGFWEFASEHKIFSGIVGAMIVVVTTIVIAVAAGRNGSGTDTTASFAEGPRQSPTAGKVTPDDDEDRVVNALDGCPYEAGEEPDGCPDQDEDGLPDGEDRCPEEKAPTSDGCPVQPNVIGLLDYAEEYGHEFQATENAVREQVTVAGIIDPKGVWMQVGGAYHSAALTVPVNRAFQWVRGRVGITSEPCSIGSSAYVAIRDAEGQPLWPENGRLKTIHRDAVSFKISIASEDAVTLYAEAPKAAGGYCGGSGYGTTEVGWVHSELIAE